MKLKTSPLEIIDFYILQSGFQFTKPKEKKFNFKEFFKRYEVNIDFSINIEKEINLLVFVKIEVNNDKNHLEGYQIIVEGVSIFDIRKIQDLSEKDKSSLMFYSSVSIAINNIRNYISLLTSSSPLGKYNLPAIDVNDLLLQKKQLSKKESNTGK